MNHPTQTHSNRHHGLTRCRNPHSSPRLKLASTGAVLLATASFVAAEAVSDVVVGYSATWRAGMGGTDQTNAAIYNQFGGANWIAGQSGSPHRMNVVATKESAHDPTNEVDCGAMIGWMWNYDGRITDVLGVADNLGADLVAYIGDMYNNGAAAQASQPGRYSCYEQQWFWQNVVAHETGGHNFGLDHAVGHNNPTTIMLHNYCGGSQPFFSNPNLWLNGVKLLGDGSCIGYLAQGGDAVYNLSVAAQGRADDHERRVWGSWLGAPKHRWQFNQSAAAAPAGTTITDSVSGAVATVRGQGATFSGNGLRLPGGTTGNTDANSIAAYLDLPNGLFSSMPNFTIEIWATPLSAQNWMRVIDIGRTTEAGDGLGAAGEYTGSPGSPAPGGTSSYDSIMLSAAIGSNLNNQRFEAKLGGTGVATADSNLGTTAGELHHYAITFADTATGGTVKWFRDGVLIETLTVGFHSASLQDVNNWLGRSLWSGDAMAHIEYHDIRVQSAAIADGEVAGNYRIGRHDSVSTMWASDGYGNSGFTSGAWEFGGTPVSTRDYEVGTMMLRSPFTGNSTFPGRSLSLNGGKFHLNGNAAKTTTVNDLRLNGGEIGSFAEGGAAQTLAGNITVTPGSFNHFRGGWGPLTLSSTLSGDNSWSAMLYTENTVTLTGNNSNYRGQTIIGDGRFSTLRISNENNLGGNPANYGGAWLELNRGILETTATMTIDDANRGVRIGPSGGFIRPASGTTLTIASPMTSPASGDNVQTSPLWPNPVAGIFFKDGAGTLVLTNPNNSYIGEMQILDGELRLDGAGRFNNGDHHMPTTLNGTLNLNTTANQTLGGAISGTGTILKNNTGTLTLWGANTYTGPTLVNAGTLTVSGSLTNTAVTISGGATLTGLGAINGSLAFQASAIHAPAIGEQPIPGTLTYAANSRLKWTLPVNSDASGAASRVAAGNVTVTSGALVDLVFNGSGSSVNFTDTFWTQPHSWTVMTASNKSGNFTLGSVSNDSGNRPASGYGIFALQQNATGVTVTYTPNALNQAPVFAANPISKPNATATAAYSNSIAGDASDPDAGNTLTFSKTSGPAWLNVAGNGALTGAPSAGDIGANAFTVRVTDQGGLYAEATLNITVQSSLPPGWTASDIGAVGIAGSSTESGGTYTVSGSGTDIWDTADSFQYVSQSLTGDGEIRARVTSQTNTDPWAKAGVMIRDGSGAGATHAMMILTPGNGFSFQWRATASGGSALTAGPAANTPPNNWVRLTRSGTLLTGYVSTNGTSWTQVGTTTISMSSTVTAGLAVTSHNNSALCTATFDNVSVTPYPSPWLTADIGATGLLGSAEYHNSAHTLKGAGPFGGTSDAFRYVYQTLSADGSIIARVSALQDTGTSARVGIMMRDTLATNSRMAALTVTGSGAWRWQRRTTTGGSVTTTNSSTGTAPNIWVRLVRSGNTITASRSTNGTSWTTIGSATVTMAGNCYIGLAVASGSTTTLNTSVMDSLIVVP